MNWVRRNGLSALLIALAGVVAVGCHTVEGVGRDVEAVGGGVAGTAEETRPYDQDARPRNGYRNDGYYR